MCLYVCVRVCAGALTLLHVAAAAASAAVCCFLGLAQSLVAALSDDDAARLYACVRPLVAPVSDEAHGDASAAHGDATAQKRAFKVRVAALERARCTGGGAPTRARARRCWSACARTRRRGCSARRSGATT